MTGVGSVPFVVGQWVRGSRFYGRAAQIAEILDGPRNWIWVVGTRRLGKTSLLKQLEHLATTEPERGYLPIFWDLQGAENAGELQAALREALYDAEEQFEAVGVDLADVLTDHAVTTLIQTRRRLKTAGRRMLLLCDEAEELIAIHRNDPALLRRLRRTLQAHDDMRVVLTSTIRLGELATERGDTSLFLLGFAPPLYLSTLRDEDASALIRQTHLASDTRPVLTDEQVEVIRTRCDNHPYLLQLVCKRFLERGDPAALDEVCRQVATDRMVSYFWRSTSRCSRRSSNRFCASSPCSRPPRAARSEARSGSTTAPSAAGWNDSRSWRSSECPTHLPSRRIRAAQVSDDAMG